LVSFVVWKRFFAPLKKMTARRLQWLQNFFAMPQAMLVLPNSQVLGTSTFTREAVTKVQSRWSCLLVWMRS
jgi:hypothetical protein